MKLRELLREVEGQRYGCDEELCITAVHYDSRQEVLLDSLFVCIPGAVYDGHDYAVKMAESGARVIVCEHEILGLPEGTGVVITKDTRKALARMAAAWFAYPARRLTTIGITGTKGKTTTAFMIREILREAGIKTGMIGTVLIDNGGEQIEASHSTPESFLVQQYFHEMVENGCRAVVMEVSSQGLKLSRVEGIEFDYAIFTNLEPDHIGANEHPDFEDYKACKALLFQHARVGIFNADDSHAAEMMAGATCERTMSFSIEKEADLRAEDIRLMQLDGILQVAYRTKGYLTGEWRVPVPGRFSVYNSLAAILLAGCLSVPDFEGATVPIPLSVIREALLHVSVPGRLELVPVSKRFSVVIDYAHNAMSLRSLLSALRQCNPKRLVCLFGCGGNRSRDRRFEMGEISSAHADLTIVTSDNPRFEKPEDIIADIVTGIKRANGEYTVIVDRAQAIRYALSKAQEGDIIVIAGKGHETYQEICGVKHPMDDRGLIADAAREEGFDAF